LEAVGRVSVLEIEATLRGPGLEDQLVRLIRHKLTVILGPPIAASKPKLAPKKLPLIAPKGISQVAWNEVMALRKSDRRRQAKRRAERMAA
jgi:hypothetical protein